MSECLVIGGGIMGLLTAMELHQGGAGVTLLERGEIGREASWAGGGILSPLYPWRYPESINILAAWSQARYPELAQSLRRETGIDAEYTRNGMLVLDAEDSDIALAWAQQHDVQMETPSPEQIGEIEPRLAPPLEPALWMPEVAQIRNPRLGKALRTLLHGRIEILENTEVTGLLVEGDRVTGARAGEREVRADTTIICAGAWSHELLASLPSAPEIEPVLGQMILIRAEPDMVRRIDLKHGSYIIPRRDGRILVGSTVEHTSFRKETTAEGLDALRTSALELFPFLVSYPIEKHWAGLRPGSPGGIPYIGPHPDLGGLYVNAGHFRNGVVTAPASARLVADLVLSRPPILDPSPYDLKADRG